MYVRAGIEVHTHTQNDKKGVFICCERIPLVYGCSLKEKKITIRKVNDRLLDIFWQLQSLKRSHRLPN